MITQVNEETSSKEFGEFIDNAFVAMCRARNKSKHTVEYDDEKQELIFHYIDGTADRVQITQIEDYKPKVPFFKDLKTLKLGIYKDADALRKALRTNGNSISDWANEILGKLAFTISSAEEEFQLVITSVANLGFKEGATYRNICAKAKELGLELCPGEVGPQLRLQYKNQPKGEWLRIAMEPITVSGSFLCIFEVENITGGLWLRCSDGRSDTFWGADISVVFCLRKKC